MFLWVSEPVTKRCVMALYRKLPYIDSQYSKHFVSNSMHHWMLIVDKNRLLIYSSQVWRGRGTPIFGIPFIRVVHNQGLKFREKMADWHGTARHGLPKNADWHGTARHGLQNVVARHGTRHESTKAKKTKKWYKKCFNHGFDALFLFLRSVLVIVSVFWYVGGVWYCWFHI